MNREPICNDTSKSSPTKYLIYRYLFPMVIASNLKKEKSVDKISIATKKFKLLISKKWKRDANIQYNFLLTHIRTKIPFGSYLARNVIGRCHRRLHTDTYTYMQISRGKPTPVPEISVQSARNSYNITGGWDVRGPPSPRPTVRANGVGVEGCRVSKENRD